MISTDPATAAGKAGELREFLLSDPEAAAYGDGAAGQGSVTQEILRTPFVKEILKMYLAHMDPETAPSKVRTLLWEDPEVALSLLSALPAMINRAAAILKAAGDEIQEKFPPGLLNGYVSAIGSDIDKEGLRDSLDTTWKLIQGLIEQSPEFEDSLLSAVKGPVAGAVGKGVDTKVKVINRARDKDPDYIADVITGVIARIDPDEFSRASMGIVNAVLDRVSVFKLGWHLIVSRIRYKLNKKKE